MHDENLQWPEPPARHQAKIINLVGGPNTGKTTTALGLTYYMKLAGLRVKYVQEYAEDMVYEDRENILDDQLYILAKQNRRALRLEERTDFVVVDSPLFLSLVYAKDGGTPALRQIVWECWDHYNNITFYHPRDLNFTYHGHGRVQQSHDECRAIDQRIERFLSHPNVRSSAYELDLGRDYVRQIIEFMKLPVPLPNGLLHTPGTEPSAPPLYSGAPETAGEDDRYDRPA